MAMIVAMPASAASRIESAAKRGGHEDHRRVRAGRIDRAVEGVEDGHALDVLAALARRHARHQLRAVAPVVHRVEGALAAGDARHAQARLVVDQDAHRASSTTFSAASFIVAAVCTLGSCASARIRRPSSSLVPSSLTTKGTVGVDLVERLDQPVGHLVAARDPAEDVEEHGLDVRVGEDDLDRAGDRLGLRAAARVEEVGGLAAVLSHHVEGRHDEPRAVAEDADVAVERDVGQPALLGHLLLRVLGRGVAQLGVVGVAHERVVVERHLGVERAHLAVGRDDERVDLDEHRLLGHEGPVQAVQEGADRAHEVGVDARLVGQPAPMEVLEAQQRIDVQRGDRARVLLGHGLDVHAAAGGEHDQRLLGAAVEDDRGVVLGRDLRCALHPHLVDGEAADVHPEDGVGVLARLVLVVGQLDPAGLPAAPDLHLCLDDAREADLLGGRDGLVDGARRASVWDGDVVAGEELLALIFEQVHGGRGD